MSLKDHYQNNLLDIQDLSVWYRTFRGFSKVVDGINLTVRKGEKIGLVGESGCGKTTTMKTILQLLNKEQVHIPGGRILINDRDILKMNSDEILTVRRKNVSMISQEPMAALNPVFTIGQQFFDVIKYSGAFNDKTKKEWRDISKKAIEMVLISDSERILNSYPYQLSGGMRQRICIALSLVTPRDLLIADEPGTALDVTIQDQIHNLLRSLVKDNEISLIMITHSLGVARELVDKIFIMYAGNIVEEASTKSLFNQPLHPYTKGLFECVPRLFGGGISSGIYGYVPDYINPGMGCRFEPRCPQAMSICSQEKPRQVSIDEDHYVSCFLYDK